MNQRGILHKVMLFIILILGFGLALSLPAFKRHQDQRHARQTLQIVKDIGAAEQDFYAQNGFYTADFSQFAPKSCKQQVQEGQSVLVCAGYNISLNEANILQAASTKYSQWFVITLDNGTLSCEYENDNLVGQQLCRAVHL